MTYADTDFWVALMKQDDWLKQKAEKILEEQDSVETSLTTFIELSLILKRFDVQKEEAFGEILQIADVDFEEKIVFQALEYMDKGLNTFNAFQAAHAGSGIISADKEFDKIDIERIKLEEE
ncbi:MAG: type II toxin-antitoxin system VapC family toxin [Candidatus Nanohaloarchaea archaeon]